MLGEAPTFVGGLFGSPAHRELNLKKIENGYVVDVTIQQKIRHPVPGYQGVGTAEYEPTYAETRRRYCFYTEAEVVDFVESFLAAPPGEFTKEPSDAG